MITDNKTNRKKQKGDGDMKKSVKLTKEQRECMIADVVEIMPLDVVIWFEMAILGWKKEKIENEIGTMSTNQWRAALNMSLIDLILEKR